MYDFGITSLGALNKGMWNSSLSLILKFMPIWYEIGSFSKMYIKHSQQEMLQPFLASQSCT